VTLANKVARIAWKLMATGESYEAARMNAMPAFAA
jgi:transposase